MAELVASILFPHISFVETGGAFETKNGKQRFYVMERVSHIATGMLLRILLPTSTILLRLLEKRLWNNKNNNNNLYFHERVMAGGGKESCNLKGLTGPQLPKEGNGDGFCL